MSEDRPPHPAECHQQMVEFVKAGRSPTELSRQCNVTAQSINNWFGQAVARRRGLTSSERLELAWLRRPLRQLQPEPTSWQMPRPGLPFAAMRFQRSLRKRDGEPGRLPHPPPHNRSWQLAPQAPASSTKRGVTAPRPHVDGQCLSVASAGRQAVDFPKIKAARSMFLAAFVIAIGGAGGI